MIAAAMISATKPQILTLMVPVATSSPAVKSIESPGKEEAHQQAGFGEDDAADQQHNPRRQGGVGQEDLGVQPVGQEGGQLRLDRSCAADRGHGKVTQS